MLTLARITPGERLPAAYCDEVGGVAARPDDHLGVLMFASGTETAGSGRYAGGQWETSTKGRATDAAVRMVTLHEIMHAELNDSTAWGSLFHAYATLVQHAADAGAYRVWGARRRAISQSPRFRLARLFRLWNFMPLKLGTGTAMATSGVAGNWVVNPSACAADQPDGPAPSVPHRDMHPGEQADAIFAVPELVIGQAVPQRGGRDHPGPALPGQHLSRKAARAGLDHSRSLREAERRTGIHNAHISQIETGAITQPAPNILWALAEAYGLDLGELMRLSGHVEAAVKGTPGSVVGAALRALGDMTPGEQEQVLDFIQEIQKGKGAE